MLSSPPSEDPLASFDFLWEFLPAIDFGEGFRFDEPFNFDDSGDGISMITTGSSPSYGAYDDNSCSFSVESSVRLCCHRRRHKRRSPNCLYRKESGKLLVRVLVLEARRATQAERWAAAERASCNRVHEVAAASRLGKLVVRFDYDLTLLVAGRRIRLTWRQRRGRDVGGVEQGLVIAGGRDPRR